MRNVYAIQVQVRPSPSRNLTWASLIDAACDWVRAWYGRREVAVVLSAAASKATPADGHIIQIANDEAPTGERLWTLSWSYPADDDPSLLWQANVAVAARAEEIEVSVLLRVGSRSYRVAPPSFRLRRPNLVRTVVTRFECSIGGRKVDNEAGPVAAVGVAGLVEDIRSPERRLPVVLISRDPYSDRPLLDAKALADQLAGLAHTRLFTDKWAAFRLTSLIGRQHSCFNGAVRIYWPIAKAGDEVRADRPFMPEEVRGDQSLVAERLLRRLAAASAFRFVEMDTTRAVRSALDQAKFEAQVRAREKALAEAGDRSELEALVNGLMDDKASLRTTVQKERDDADHLRVELAEKNERIAELEEELKDLRRNIGVVTIARAPVEGRIPDEDVDPATVPEALEEAATRFGPRLAVLDTARRSAAASDFARPAEVFQALWAIKDVAETYFASKREGRPMGRWAEAFEARGIKFAPQETQATMNQYGAERDFTNDGVKRRFEKHVTLGGGDKKNCLQIYFDADDANERFVVVHCGRHLRTDKYH